MGIIFLVLGIALSVAQSILLNTSFSTVLMISAFVAAAMGIILVVVPCLNPEWIGAETLPDETITASEVKSFLRILPLLFTANLAFSCVYNSMQFWYQQQACQMDVRMPWSTSGSQFAGSFFMIADCLAIVLATPLAVDVFNPMIDKSLGGRFGYGAKYGLGMAFGVASVMVAAHMEQVRRQAHILPLVSNCAAPGIHMSEMSASWMVLPFFLMGVGEIYTQPVLMHLAYTKSPTSMRTLTSVVGLVIGAVSNAIFTVTVAAVSPWVPNDLNDGHLEYGHYTNIALGVLAYFAFVATLQHFEHAPQE
jgi:dipeptide/tripeptide permease